jgi:arylsulfatase A-like enzyme
MQRDRAAETIHETLFWRTGPEFAVLKGNWKLLSNTRPGAFPWLFDLAADPGEQRTLTFANREVVADLQRRYREWEAQMRPPAWQPKQIIQVFQCGRISFHEQ